MTGVWLMPSLTANATVPGVHLEEVARHDASGLSPQELRPARASSGRRSDPGAPQGRADRGRTDPVAQALQFTLDPDHAPPGVVLRHLHDQGDDLGIERWSSGLLVAECP